MIKFDDDRNGDIFLFYYVIERVIPGYILSYLKIIFNSKQVNDKL